MDIGAEQSCGVMVLSRTSARRALAIVESGGRAEAIVWPGMGAQWRSLHRLELGPGGRTVVLQHASEAVYFVTTGDAEIVDERSGDHLALPVGSMVHIGPEHPYRFVGATATRAVRWQACPPDVTMYGDPGGGGAARAHAAECAMTIRIFHRDRPSHLLPPISSDARLIVWPGVGAEFANLNFVTMQPGEANTPHAHAASEDTIYILEGKGSVEDLTNHLCHAFEAGDVIHVPEGVRTRFAPTGASVVVSFGGPCPPDRTLFDHAVEVRGIAAGGANDMEAKD